MVDEKQLHVLEHLARRNLEAEATLKGHAEAVKNSELESIFLGFSKQHKRFASELVERVEEAPEPALQRGWEHLKAVFQGHGARALLAAISDGEESLESAYLDAENDISQGKMHVLLSKQREQIQQFRTRIVRLLSEAKDGLEFQDNE